MSGGEVQGGGGDYKMGDYTWHLQSGSILKNDFKTGLETFLDSLSSEQYDKLAASAQALGMDVTTYVAHVASDKPNLPKPMTGNFVAFGQTGPTHGPVAGNAWLNASCLVSLLVIMQRVLWAEALKGEIDKINVGKGMEAESALGLAGQEMYNKMAANAIAKGLTTGIIEIVGGLISVGFAMHSISKMGDSMKQDKPLMEEEADNNRALEGDPKAKPKTKGLYAEREEQQAELTEAESESGPDADAIGAAGSMKGDKAKLARQERVKKAKDHLEATNKKISKLERRNKLIKEQREDIHRSEQGVTAINRELSQGISQITRGIAQIVSGFYEGWGLQLQGKMQALVTTPSEILKTYLQSLSKEASDSDSAVNEAANLMKQLAQEHHQAFYSA